MGTKRTRDALIALFLAGVGSSILVACSESSGGAGPDAGPSGSESGAASSGSGSGAASSGSTDGGSGSSSGATGAEGSAPAGITGLFLDGFNIVSPHSSVVYDAKGGLHVAGYAGSSLRYGECFSQCWQSTKWAYANIPTTSLQNVSGQGTVDLAVDGQGHPRVMAAREYAECNATDCGNAANWTGTDIEPPPVGMPPYVPLPRGDEFFAVAPQGGAAYVYFGAGNLMYSSCPSDCSVKANWQQTVVMAAPSSSVGAATYALAFDAAGTSHIVFDFYESENSGGGFMGPGTKTWYATCGGNCTTTSAWAITSFGSTALVPSVGHPLALDSQGRPTLLGGMSHCYSCDGNCATDSSSWQGPAMTPIAFWASVDAQNDLRVAQTGTYAACTAGCNGTSAMWTKIALPYSDLDKADSTLMSGDQWGEFTPGAARSTLSLDMAGNAAVTLDAERDYLDPVSGNSQADAYGVYLWLIPAIADSAGSSSGSGGRSGGAEAGSGGLSNFEGATWTGTLTETLSCGDAGMKTATPSESIALVPTASGLSYTDKDGCTFDFTVSGSTATLSNAPLACNVSTDAGVMEIQYTSGTLTSADGHNLAVDAQGSLHSGSLSCSVVESGTLTR